MSAGRATGRHSSATKQSCLNRCHTSAGNSGEKSGAEIENVFVLHEFESQLYMNLLEKVIQMFTFTLMRQTVFQSHLSVIPPQ